jgi:16S rRNA processing protein RimM
MAYKNDILLGRITKLSGFEGAIIVKLEKIFIQNIPRMESVFLEIEGRPVPFFISDLEYSGSDILKLWFDGYNSIEKISEFIGCSIFLTSSLPDDKKDTDDQDLIGYLVFNQEKILLGSISEIISNNGQWLINVIFNNKKDFLIPFHENLIISIDQDKKTVIMDIPEGLLEIN